MTDRENVHQSLRSLLIGFCLLLILGLILSITFAKTIPASPVTPTVQSSTPLVTPSAAQSVDFLATKIQMDVVLATRAAVDQMWQQTHTAIAKTPWWIGITIFPPPPQKPTSTPNFSEVRNQIAGDGVIVWERLDGVKNYPMGVYNQWYDIPAGVRVLAGGINADQGVIGVIPDNLDFLTPEIYLTPRISGPVQIIDAQGQRLVLQARNGDLFYFDIPTRQYAASLTVTIVAPTVTPLPTFTPQPTIQYIPVETIYYNLRLTATAYYNLMLTPTSGMLTPTSGAYPPPSTQIPIPSETPMP